MSPKMANPKGVAPPFVNNETHVVVQITDDPTFAYVNLPTFHLLAINKTFRTWKKKDIGANYSMDDGSENFMTQLPTYKFYKMTSGTDMISRKEFMTVTLVPILKFLQVNFVLFLRPAEGRLIFLPYHLSVILKVISCFYWVVACFNAFLHVRNSRIRHNGRQELMTYPVFHKATWFTFLELQQLLHLPHWL
jgi:hypothetical protein